MFKYSKQVIRHFTHPKNVGVIKNASGTGKVTSHVCGDYMFLYIKVKNGKIAKITDAKFKTYGCAASIACSSVLTELVKNKTLAEAKKITKKQIIKKLKGLPALKIHCADMAIDALHSAIANYKKQEKNTRRKKKR